MNEITVNNFDDRKINRVIDELATIGNVKQHKDILDSIHNTYIAKNNDYGNSFTKSFDKYGITCAMVRMEDKWNRLESLTSGKKQMVNDESIKDTLLDLANYAIMTVIELENRK